MTMPRLLTVTLVLLLSLSLLFGEAAAAAAGIVPPSGTRYYRISTGTERAGFLRTTLTPIRGGYEIRSESSLAMSMLGFSRKSWSRERYRVATDLSLASFASETEIDGKRNLTGGDIIPGGIRITVAGPDGSIRQKTLKTKEKVTPGPLLNLYPLLHGRSGARTYRPVTLDTEEVKLKKVTVELVGEERLGAVPVIHLRNDLYPFVDNDIWIDRAGNTLKESVRDGLVETVAETAEESNRYLFSETLSRNPLVLPFTAVKPDRPIENPAALTLLVLEICGVPADLPLLSDDRQEMARLPNGNLLVTLRKLPVPGQSAQGEAVGREVAGLQLTGDAFLYGRWGEIRHGTWFPVEPETGAVRTDLLQVRLTEGPAEIFAQTVGKIAVRVLEMKY